LTGEQLMNQIYEVSGTLLVVEVLNVTLSVMGVEVCVAVAVM